MGMCLILPCSKPLETLNAKLDLYVLQMRSKKYWATIYSLSQQIRLGGWYRYLLFTLTQINNLSGSPKLERMLLFATV